MGLQTAATIQGGVLNSLRRKMESTGYVEVTIMANGFDNSPAVLATIDGKSLATTIPVPVDSCVLVTIEGAVYLDDVDGDVDFAETVAITVAARRIGSGNVAVMQVVNTANTVGEIAARYNSADAATAGQLTIAATADTTNQGIDITFANDAADENGYFVGRAKIVCAKKGGFGIDYAGIA